VRGGHGGFCGEGELLPQVFTTDEHCSKLAHVCHCAKFEKSDNPWQRYSDLADWTRPVSTTLRHLTRCRIPFSVYTPNMVKISGLMPEICPLNEIQ